MDPVIQIASLVTVHGQSSPVVKNILTLNDCAQIIGAEVMSFDREHDLLKRWRVSVANVCSSNVPVCSSRPARHAYMQALP